MGRKISFLMAVHNEEKILRQSLEHLTKIPYENYEVILGLDGCKDKSEEITKKFVNKYPRIFRYFILNERKGKPEVIDKIIKEAKGEIIVINDADWFFTVKSENEMKEFVKIFDNPKIGGVAESFPPEWELNKIKNGNLGYKMVAYSSYFWFNFQKRNFAFEKDGLLYIKNPQMFLTNIFRKELYEKNFSLGDDFERTQQIVNNGYKIILFQNPNYPKNIVIYNKVKIKEIFNQKIRTATARKQLEEKYFSKVDIPNYYLPATFYIFKEAWRKNLGIGLLMSAWISLTAFATLIARFKTLDTKEGWKMRLKR
ncbi:MAG: glycosyltransferase [Candidatus Pacearchaeota archaeon]